MDIPEWTKKIEYGLTNDSYLLYTNIVLRIGNYKVNKLVDRINEMNILETIKEKKYDFTVKILDYGFNNDDAFFLKTKYLPFAFNLVQQKIDKEKINKIFDILKKFKSVNFKNKKIKTFDWKKNLQLFKSNIKKHQIDLTEYEIELAKIFQNYKPKKLVISHNNLVRNNFLFDDNETSQKLYLIDFEFSSYNDELYDIASFISESLIYEENIKTQEMLKKYWISLFNLSEDDKKIVNKWVFYQNILSVFYANAMYDITKEKEFLKLIEIKYHEIKKMY